MVGTTDLLELNNADFSPGKVICTAKATDASGGYGVLADEVVIDNSAPVISTVSISPNTGIKTDTELTCSASATDPDGGTVNATVGFRSVGCLRPP